MVAYTCLLCVVGYGRPPPELCCIIERYDMISGVDERKREV